MIQSGEFRNASSKTSFTFPLNRNILSKNWLQFNQLTPKTLETLTAMSYNAKLEAMIDAAAKWDICG
jgi:hypothetical protein